MEGRLFLALKYFPGIHLPLHTLHTLHTLHSLQIKRDSILSKEKEDDR